MLKRITSISLLLFGIAACADNKPPTTDDESQYELPQEQEVERRGGYRRIPVPVPAQSQGEIVGEAPEAAITATKDELARNLGISPDVIDVEMATAVTWNDGALGCAQPGQAYTQAIVRGYQLILEVEGRRYDYRVTEQGYFLLCELPMLLPAPAIKKR
jgi:hypothetical protein